MLATPPLLAAPPPALVEVFKTNVESAAQAAAVVHVLHACFGQLERVSFDLHDCDRVLRVQAGAAARPELWEQVTEQLMRLVGGLGVAIERLPD